MSTGLLTAAQVAERLQSSTAFVLRELKRKNLRGSNLKGVGWRITEADLQTYLDAKANVSKVRRSA